MKKINLMLPILVSLISFIVAHTGEDDYAHHSMMRGMTGTYGLGFGIFMWLFWLLAIVALVLLIVWLIKQIEKPRNKKRR